MVKINAYRRLIFAAGLASGNEGTIRLAAQLIGIAPCEKCDFIKQHCRCVKQENK